MWNITVLALLCGVCWVECKFMECHDDPTMDPDEGPLSEMQFTWLGALQYIHVKNGTPHFFRVPRVVLVSRQFVLSTAVDAAQVPEGYALGNVAFGEYERDEAECGVTVEMLAAGARCEAAVLVVPLADVLLHPEYKHFGAPDSVALLKLITPIKSRYMLPVCLPFKDYLVSRSGRPTRQRFFHVDFTNDVPRHIVEEEKEVSRLTLLPRELCYLYGGEHNNTKMMKNTVMCTTGCGFHSGAPTVVHEHTGHWALVALAQGGSPCPDPLRARRPPLPPLHIAIQPYVRWITAAVTGKAVDAVANDDPFGYGIPRATVYDFVDHKWTGHWWMGGLRCFDRGPAAEDMFKFYHEVFQVRPYGLVHLTYYLEIYAARDTKVICVKVGMPYQIGRPRVWDLDTMEVKVRIPVVKFTHAYTFQVEAWAYNASESSQSSSSSSGDDYESPSD